MEPGDTVSAGTIAGPDGREGAGPGDTGPVALGGGGGATQAISLRARRSRLRGVPGAMSTRAGQTYARALEQRVNGQLAAQGGGGGLGPGRDRVGRLVRGGRPRRRLRGILRGGVLGLLLGLLLGLGRGLDLGAVPRVAAGVVLLIAVMVVPLPPALLDAGLAVSITLSVLVLMTALPADHPERQALPAPVLTKPFSAADLAAALASAIHD